MINMVYNHYFNTIDYLGLLHILEALVVFLEPTIARNRDRKATTVSLKKNVSISA